MIKIFFSSFQLHIYHASLTFLQVTCCVWAVLVFLTTLWLIILKLKFKKSNLIVKETVIVYEVAFTDVCIYLMEICALCFLCVKWCSQKSRLVKLGVFEYISVVSIRRHMDQCFQFCPPLREMVAFMLQASCLASVCICTGLVVAWCSFMPPTVN